MSRQIQEIFDSTWETVTIDNYGCPCGGNTFVTMREGGVTSLGAALAEKHGLSRETLVREYWCWNCMKIHYQTVE